MPLESLPVAAFIAAATIITLGAILLAGHFPVERLPQPLRSGSSRGLVWLNLLLLAGLLFVALAIAVQRMPWPAAVIGGGLAVLFAPLLFQVLPARWRDGRTGLLGQALLSAALLILLLPLVQG